MKVIHMALALAIVLGGGAAMAQQAVAPSTEDLQTAYALCTKRYVERDKSRRYDSTGKEIAKWQDGFENCDKIVQMHDTARTKWGDVSKHKSMIDSLASGKGGN